MNLLLSDPNYGQNFKDKMLTLNIECLDPIVQASVYKTFSQIIINFDDNNHESIV